MWVRIASHLCVTPIMSSQNRSQSQAGICCPTLMVTDVEELHEIEKLRGAQIARDHI